MNLIGIEGKAIQMKNAGLSREDAQAWLSAQPENGYDPAQAAELIDKIYQFGVTVKSLNLTDVGNGKRLIQYHGHDLHYCYERNKWLYWTGENWEWDAGAKIMELAKETARHMYREAAEEPDDNKRKDLISHALRMESNARLSAMIECAQSEPGIPIKETELDADPWLFNVLNGTINLKTGELQPHNREDLQSIIIPVTYDPAATSPLWQSFLDRITGNHNPKDQEELKDFLQRAVGMSMTGQATSEVVFFPYGTGANGKTKFTETILHLLGAYGQTLPADALMNQKMSNGSHNESIANLRGKRYVVTSEIKQGSELNEGLLKSLSGGDTYRASRKYEHEIEFTPTYTLWMMGNHKPIIKDTTESTWRRLRLIHFNVTIPPSERDEKLLEKLLAELPGILNWAVTGCLQWQKEGLGYPDVIRMATMAYRADSDVLGEFIDDCCVLDFQGYVKKADLKKSYEDWCHDTGVEMIKQTTFKTRLQEKGIRDYKGTGGVRFWKGIRLQTNDEKVARVAKVTDFPENLYDFSLREKVIEKPATNAIIATIDTKNTPKTDITGNTDATNATQFLLNYCPVCQKEVETVDGICTICGSEINGIKKTLL